MENNIQKKIEEVYQCDQGMDSVTGFFILAEERC